ncbi:FecR family protein [Steroidobacter sp.]|uniref:FecR family protein n=1 Tax=Steroidobacter sp. TaxID=1978227 RepID=UPI001A3D1B85|nr:FecR domain-containing protein [Steroidobacter sp.]MBL8267165.1 FecR domain-containing protein [Steroidobacter sp.]
MTLVQKQIDRLLAQRASEWVEILKTAGPAEREAFVDWLRESRRHVEEFLTAVAIEKELDGLDMQGRFDRDALLRRVCATIAPLPLPATDTTSVVTKPRRHIGRRWAAALAAGFAVAIISLLFAGDFFVPTQNFVTAPGMQQSVELKDGSVVQLNADSHVQVRLRRSTRELQLLRGEALFKVAHDANRPFRVHAGNAVVQALGTQFNVSKQATGTVVSVVEGKVRVSSANDASGSNALASNEASNGTLPVAALIAGQQAVVASTGAITRNEAADVKQTLAWQPQRLVFRQTSLEDIVHQFNSHNVTPKLRLIGIDPGSHHYSATFDAEDPQSFGDLLEKEPDLAVERRAGEILIRRR